LSGRSNSGGAESTAACGDNATVTTTPLGSAVERRQGVRRHLPAFLIGGEPGKPNYGVMLCLPSPERIVRDFDESPPS
jgi:hypothetical protein